MRRLFGFVKVRETDDGIPNLVVAAYDAPDNPIPSNNRALIEQPIPTGRPIASVLTRSDGFFEFTEDDLTFQGNEARPNLVVIVFAPEDVRIPEVPLPDSPMLRILYMSHSSRRDAGSQEAYIIRIAGERLDELEIPYGLNHAIASTWKNRGRQREILKPWYLFEHERTRAYRAYAREKVAKLVAGSRRLMGSDIRNSKYLIVHKDDLSRKLPGFQKDAVKQGLAQLEKQNPTLRLRLTDDDLKELGLNPDKSGNWTGNVGAEKLVAKTRTLLGSSGLMRTRGAEHALSLEELDRRYPAPLAQTPAASKPKSGSKLASKPEVSSKSSAGDRALPKSTPRAAKPGPGG